MASWIPSLNALRALETTARNGSYSKAADELNVTPAAVKQLVAKLEDAMGAKLLLRSGHGMVLTDIGKEGIEDLSKGFGLIARSVDSMSASNLGKRLIISVDPSFAAAWLVPRLSDFKRKNPDIEILIESTVELADLENGHADVGIRYGVLDHGNLVCHRLFDEQLSALCSPEYASVNAASGRLKDLARASLLSWDLPQGDQSKNTRTWNQWETWLMAVGAPQIPTGSALRFSDYNLAVQAAIAGQGFIIGSKPVLADTLGVGLLVDPFSKSVNPSMGYDVATSHQTSKRSAVQLFMNWIIKKAAP